jgi:hypothetical protein
MYYNDTIDACSSKTLTSLNTSLNQEARSLIDNALWYLGGNDTSDLYADDYYNMERNNAGYGSNPTRWTGSVGIMYLSDYLYATDLGVCKKPGMDTTDWIGYSDSNCKDNDWLYNGDYQWLISPYPYLDYSNGAWAVQAMGDVNGYVGQSYGVEDYRGVSPLVVLSFDVTKVEGDGTSGNPYKLGVGA